MLSLPGPYHILLSFDLEEFDIPNEYGGCIEEPMQMQVAREGMDRLLPLLDHLQARSTFFTTAHYANQHKEQIRKLARVHEIASHAFYHSHFSIADVSASKQVLENISQKAVTGFRMPRLAAIPRDVLIRAGYDYDASLNPTLLPGRYNKLRSPRTIFHEGRLSVVPASVTPNLRIPLFWLAFKNAPLPLLKFWSKQVLKRDGYISLYFHPWEYADLERFADLPVYVRKPSGEQLLNKLSDYLHWLAGLGQFTRMQDFVRKHRATIHSDLDGIGTRILRRKEA
jgi:hypothetical protein